MATPFTTDKLFDVSGLVAVITGGHTGIGLMCTQALAQNGARVYILGRREETLKQSADVHKGDIRPIQADVHDIESIKAAVKEIEKTESSIDLLINNSGVSGPGFDGSVKTAAEVGEQILGADYTGAMDLFKTNVLGYFYVSGAFLPLLGKSKNEGGAQIINITSNAAYGRKSMAGLLYSTTKAATVHMTKMLATHLAESNVRVNSIAPGLFPSEMTAGDSDSKTNESEVDTMGLPIPAGRAGTGAEMAHAVLFLASRNQSYTNGSIILIDGGVLANGMPGSY